MPPVRKIENRLEDRIEEDPSIAYAMQAGNRFIHVDKVKELITQAKEETRESIRKEIGELDTWEHGEHEEVIACRDCEKLEVIKQLLALPSLRSATK